MTLYRFGSIFPGWEEKAESLTIVPNQKVTASDGRDVPRLRLQCW